MTISKESLLIQVEKLKSENQKLKQQLSSEQNNEYTSVLKELSFSDLIDIPLVQNLMDHFNKLTGYQSAILDTEQNILVAVGWQQICTKYFRANKESCKRCHESDQYIKQHLTKGDFIEYKCKNGLWDIAQPIIIEGQHIATIFLGQFFYDDETVDISFFEKQASKYNFNKDDFMLALQKVPRFSRKEIQEAMTFYNQLAQTLSQQGLINLKLKEEVKRSNQRKKELTRSENRLNSIINSIPSPIFVKDINDRITMCNDMYSEKLMLDKSDIIGKTDFDLVSIELAKFSQKKNQELLKKPGKQIYKVDLQLNNGNDYTAMIHKSTFTDENDKIVGIAGVAVDITEIEKIKVDLQKAKEKAEESDRLKSAFLANMSHEIRTPLNSILGFTELILDPDLEKEKKRKFTKIINRSGQQLLSIISDIIDISKIVSNQISLDTEKVNLNGLIDELYDDYSSKPINVKLISSKGSPDETIEIICDKYKLRQIFTNLLDNAFKFTPSGTISFGYEVTPSHYTLFVKDTGIGIPENEQENIYKRFYQVYNENSLQSGTGLGLAITKGFVEFMRGEINLYSKEGEGTEFRITLPIQSNT